MEATLRVGLPGWLVAGRQKSWATALDVSTLVEEWALALLDPVDALRRAAPAALEQPGWELCGRATVTPAVMKLVREAAADPEVVAHIEKVVGAGKLSLQGSCLVLGLAAVTALDANIGRASALMLADVKKRKATRESAAAQRERQQSAPAAARHRADRPALAPLDGGVPSSAGERPELSPMPADAWGKDVR
jgi:hypothetical protein